MACGRGEMCSMRVVRPLCIRLPNPHNLAIALPVHVFPGRHVCGWELAREADLLGTVPVGVERGHGQIRVWSWSFNRIDTTGHRHQPRLPRQVSFFLSFTLSLSALIPTPLPLLISSVASTTAWRAT